MVSLNRHYNIAKYFKCFTGDNTKPKISKTFFIFIYVSLNKNTLLIFGLVSSPVDHSKFLARFINGCVASQFSL